MVKLGIDGLGTSFRNGECQVYWLTGKRIWGQRVVQGVLQRSQCICDWRDGKKNINFILCITERHKIVFCRVMHE